MENPVESKVVGQPFEDCRSALALCTHQAIDPKSRLYVRREMSRWVAFTHFFGHDHGRDTADDSDEDKCTYTADCATADFLADIKYRCDILHFRRVCVHVRGKDFHGISGVLLLREPLDHWAMTHDNDSETLALTHCSPIRDTTARWFVDHVALYYHETRESTDEWRFEAHKVRPSPLLDILYADMPEVCGLVYKELEKLDLWLERLELQEDDDNK